MLCIRLCCLTVCLVPSQPTRQIREWSLDGRTVAGGYGQGDALNQLRFPFDFVLDDDGSFFIADTSNHRIIRSDLNATHGQFVIDVIEGPGSRAHPLKQPTAVLINPMNRCLIISERGKRRVLQWSLDRRGRVVNKSQVIISNVRSYGLAMDTRGTLYVSDIKKHEVRRYGPEDGSNGVVVAGGHGKGAGLHQLNGPQRIFVDADQSVYVSDTGNHRVMK